MIKRLLFSSSAAAALSGLALALLLAVLPAGAPSIASLIPQRAVALKHSIKENSLTGRMPLSAALVGDDDFLAPNPSEPEKRLIFNLLSVVLCFYIAAVAAGSLFSGALAAAGAALLAPADLEQALFTFMLLAALASGFRRRGKETAGNAAFTGLLLSGAFFSAGVGAPRTAVY